MRPVIVALAIALLFFGLFTVGAIYAYQAADTAQADPQPIDRYQPARDSSFPEAAPLGITLPPAPYDPSCNAPQNKDDADLCAQWAAVKAVTESNRLTRVAIKISALEGLAIAFSLVLTAFAVAVSAVAAFYARDSVSTAREMGKNQIRCYVNILHSRWNGGSNDPALSLVTHNTGQTPAGHFSIGVSIVTCDWMSDVGDIPQDLHWEGPWPSLSNRFDLSAGCHPPGLAEAIEVVTSGKKRLLVLVGKIQYTDVFSDAFESEFIFVGNKRHFTKSSKDPTDEKLQLPMTRPPRALSVYRRIEQMVSAPNPAVDEIAPAEGMGNA